MNNKLKLFLGKCSSIKQYIILKKNALLQRHAASGRCIGLKRVAATMAAIGFLGLLFPELCLTEDTCRVVYVTEDGREEVLTGEDGSELYYQLLSAEPEEMKMKSRLFEWLSSIW